MATYMEAVGAGATAGVDALSMEFEYVAPLTIENKGNASADFVATLTPASGQSGTVVLENTATGEKLELESGAISGTAPIVIDTKARTITRSGISIYNLLNFTGSDWFKLSPGSNTLKFSKGALKVQWRNAWV
jgi:phage-related protein